MAEATAERRVDRRAINAARTRIAILEAAMEMAEERRLVDVHVDEIADRAGVSRMTFFNYFGMKDALWFFFAWTWWLGESVAQAREPLRGLAAIRRTFSAVAGADRGHRRFFLEFVSFLCRASDVESMRTAMALTPQERVLLQPGVPGVEDLSILTTNQRLRQHLEEAVADGELQAGVSRDDLIVDLGGILYGGLLMAHLARKPELHPIYQRQLNALLTHDRGA